MHTRRTCASSTAPCIQALGLGPAWRGDGRKLQQKVAALQSALGQLDPAAAEAAGHSTITQLLFAYGHLYEHNALLHYLRCNPDRVVCSVGFMALDVDQLLARHPAVFDGVDLDAVRALNLGASPDGLVFHKADVDRWKDVGWSLYPPYAVNGTGGSVLMRLAGILELKSPAMPWQEEDKKAAAAKGGGEDPFWFTYPAFRHPPAHIHAQYYAQVQMQLMVTVTAPAAAFVVYAPHETYMNTVELDVPFCNDMLKVSTEPGCLKQVGVDSCVCFLSVVVVVPWCVA